SSSFIGRSRSGPWFWLPDASCIESGHTAVARLRDLIETSAKIVKTGQVTAAAGDCLLVFPRRKILLCSSRGRGACWLAYALSRRLWGWSAFHSPPSHRSFRLVRRSCRPATSLAGHASDST